MNKTVSFLAGALCGAVVGAVAALLLAPVSGDELRLRTREEVDRLVEEVQSAAEAKRAELEAQLAALKSQHRLGAGKSARPAHTPDPSL